MRLLCTGVFATLHTLTKDRQLDATIWLAVLKVVLEFLQVGLNARSVG